MAAAPVECDIVILGGGAAGLWLLDGLQRRGFRVLLVERDALGAGQTVSSQGIIHGGIKYTLAGSLTASARAIREMPGRWRDCLSGQAEPKLAATRVLSPCCHLWRTASLSSRLGMLGARAGLRSDVTVMEPNSRPELLRHCPGDVYRVDEQVIDVVSLLGDLSAHHGPRLLHGEARLEARTPQVRVSPPPSVVSSHSELLLTPQWIILAAGAGSAELRRQAGLAASAMQRRPLHMVLARSRLPQLFGHCVDGARTRATITSVADAAGRTVWQIGGQIAEVGVEMSRSEVIAHAKRELGEVLPGVRLDGVEWTSYRIDRAEAATVGGLRPEGPTVRREGNVITAWPTKLALVPELAKMVAEHVGHPSGSSPACADVANWPRPEVARPPWEVADEWHE